jgi:NDP-sugar pyrophosphorylase family protein
MTDSFENQATRAADREFRSMSSLHQTPALLLVGGLGTRLRSAVPSLPKPLASVGKKSFLELLMRQLKHQGIRRLILCTGYLADQVENEFGDGRALDLEIGYSKELEPLGTAGAVKQAQSHLGNGSEFLVMNGDSFLEIDLASFLEFHRDRGALLSMAVVRVEDSSRYGTVQVDNSQKVVGFLEKSGSNGPGLVNAGVYVFSPEVFQHIPEGRSSLEKDVFPHLIGNGVYAQEHSGMFIDIGTPEDYAKAQQLCDRLYDAALS